MQNRHTSQHTRTYFTMCFFPSIYRENGENKQCDLNEISVENIEEWKISFKHQFKGTFKERITVSSIYI